MSFQIMEAMRGARKVVEATVQPGDQVLLIGSTDMDPVAYEAIAACCKEMGCEVVVAIITPRTRFGEEPPKAVAEAMKAADVVFQSASTSIVHSLASTEAAMAGARQVSLYFPKGQEIAVLQRAADIDMDAMRDATLRCVKFVEEAIKTGRQGRITSELGTDLRFRVKDGIGDYVDGIWSVLVGPKKQPKIMCAWPPGVVHGYMEEDSANGVFVADASISGVGPLSSPMKLTFKEGWLVDFKGGEEAARLEAMLASSDREGRRITPEIGIASNPMGKVTGFVAEDKRSAGTCHIAFGRSYAILFARPGEAPFASVKSGVHMDAVATAVSLRIGDKIILDNGKPNW